MTLGRSLRLAGRASDLYGKLLGAAMLLMLGLLFTIPIVHTLPLSVLGVRVDPSAVSEAVLPWFMTLLVLFPLMLPIGHLLNVAAERQDRRILVDWASRRPGQLARGVPRLPDPHPHHQRNAAGCSGYGCLLLAPILLFGAGIAFPRAYQGDGFTTLALLSAAVAVAVSALVWRRIATRERKDRALFEALSGPYV